MALSPCNSRADEQGKELVAHGTALFPVACYHDDLRQMPVPWHWHDELEAVVVSEGVTAFFVEGEQCRLKKGEGCIINADVLHACRCEDTASGNIPAARLHSIVFHPRLVGGSAESVFQQSYVSPLIENRSWKMLVFGNKTAKDKRATAHIEAAWQACRKEPHGFEFLMREELSRLLLEITDRVPQQRNRMSVKALRNEERLKQMLEYIRLHMADDLNVAEIAAAAAVSESECMRCFKSGIGTTPMQYVKNLRLMKAAELMTQDGWKVNEAAEASGFHEMSYFARAFKEQYGVTPSQYRSRG